MDIIRFINENKSFIFAKFGDGEYYAAIKSNGQNCDGTPYTTLLGNGIIESFKYITNFPNVYIGKWEDFKGVADFFQSLTNNPINWENYNILIARNSNEFLTRTLPYFKSIRNAKQQKVYICNSYNTDIAKQILNINKFVTIDPTNWFEINYNEVLHNLINSVEDPNNVIILTSAGMGAKILIADIHKVYPNAIIIDIGSSLDAICSNRRTRDYHYAFNDTDVVNIRNAIIQ